MQSLIIQALALLIVTFGLFAALGWAVAGKKVRTKAPVVKTTADWIAEEPQRTSKVVAMPRPQPVSYLDAAAEHFTNGLVTPQPMPVQPVATPVAPVPAYPGAQPSLVFQSVPQTVANPIPTPGPTDVSDLAPRYYDMAAANHAAHRYDTGLQRRVSSLATMTPESVEAAVQQAGSGLEPVRLSAPQGLIDDLTIISGIDYASQSDLNALGIYHFWQIAGWTPEHVAWVSNRVRLSKRIARENWMSQAARLAKLS